MANQIGKFHKETGSSFENIMGGLKESGVSSLTFPLESGFDTCQEKLEENPGQNLLGETPHETAQDRSLLDQMTQASFCDTDKGLGIEELPTTVGNRWEEDLGRTGKQELEALEDELTSLISKDNIRQGLLEKITSQSKESENSGNGPISTVFKNDTLKNLLLKAGIKPEEIKNLNEKPGRSFSEVNVLKELLGKITAQTNEPQNSGNGPVSTPLNNDTLKNLLLEAGIKPEELQTSHERPGPSFSKDNILQGLLEKIASQSKEPENSGNGRIATALNNSTLKNILLEAGMEPRELQKLEQESGYSIPKGEMFKDLLTKLGIDKEKASIQNGETEAPTTKGDLLKDILTKAGINNQEAKKMTNGEVLAQERAPENDAVTSRLATIQDKGDTSNVKITIVEPTEIHLHPSEDKILSKATMADKILNQIVEKTTGQFKNGKNQITIELKPESLGRLHIRVSIQDQHVMARIMVESPLTKDIIEANSHQLKFSLMEHGIKVDKFSVFVGHDQTQSDQDYDGSPSQGSRKGYDPEEGEEAPPIREEDIPVLRGATMGRGGVDFFA